MLAAHYEIVKCPLSAYLLLPHSTYVTFAVTLICDIEKIAFKVVQIMFLAMHITNKKLRFDIFMVGNLLNIFMEHDLYLINILMIFLA